MDSSEERSSPSVSRPDQDPIAKFVTRSEELVPLLKAEEEDEDWAVDKIASGQELSDYTPLINTDSEPSVLPQSTDGTVTGQMSTGDNTVHATGQFPTENPVMTNDQSDPLAELGVCGLINIGNTCYMNAGLQCLRSLPRLMEYCLSASREVQVKEEEADNLDKATTCRTHIHATFTSLVRKLWSGQFSRIEPRLLKTTVGLLHPNFSGNRQHDSQEFLAVLLDSLYEHCSTEDSSIISETFQGELRNEVECSACGNVSVKVEPFVFLSLPLPGAYDKIIELYYVSAECPLTVTRLAVKVCRYGSLVEDVKVSLRSLLGRDVPSELLVLTEVLSGTVVRTLTDSLPLDRLSSKRGEKLYMFEMTPAQDVVSSLRSDPTPPDADLFGAPPFSTGISTNGDTPNISSSEVTARMEDATEVAMETEGRTEVAIETEPPAVVMMEWHSCNICLEEMVDADLLTHAQCGGTLCKDCLQSSKSHQEAAGQKRIACPICSKPLSEESNFTPMIEGGTSSSDAISLLLVTVLYRSSESLVGHPLLRHLPTQAQGVVFYGEITKLLPFSLSKVSFTLKLTDDKGRCCSRCDFSSGCPGCVLSTGESGNLKPGDHLTVQFNTPLTADQISTLELVNEHPSLSLLDTRQLTLNDCLKTFAQRETLSSDNSWFCPKCEGQRLAERTLSVEKVPQTLIVHLKRFIYHGREGNKVEGSVSFPLELSGVSKNDSTPLQLTACVCHTGTLHFGHYTAYCKHPCTGEWLYYNDSSSTKVNTPACQDSVYMLFYQKPTTPPHVEKAKDKFDDSSERVAIETLLRLFKPVLPKAPPPPPLKRSSSNPDVSVEVKVQPGRISPIIKSSSVTKPVSAAVCPW